MKKLIKTILIFLSMAALTACGAESGEKLDGSVKMTAVVKSVDERIEVEVTESEYTSGVHLVITADATEYFGKNGKRIDRNDIKAGDTVEILYSGQVMLSYPPQIVAAKITVK